MKGLFLQGGGAKGAFQAGVIYGLYQMGYSFDIISGTSIGAVNSYYIYRDNIDGLKELWNNINSEESKNIQIEDIVIDNKQIINSLKNFDGRDERIKKIFINYIEIQGRNPIEIRKDIVDLSINEQMEIIGYSSLLPCRNHGVQSLGDIISKTDPRKAMDNFKEDLYKGIYDGYKLDGGILNNNFLEPFIENKVNKLFLIVFKKDYEIPNYILNEYAPEDIIVIEPDRVFEPGDTLRFEGKFCRDLFDEGYKVVKRKFKNKPL